MRHRGPVRRRVFLFLQGPHGPFFRRLGEALAAAGHGVRHINFNGGDAAGWPGGTNYVGTAAGWGNYVRDFIAREGVTDLILYGDARPLHATAVAIARVVGATVHVFEEGYIRPDWVTLERDGVNGYSTLPRDPAWYRDQAGDLPAMEEYPPLPSFALRREWAALFYYLDIVLRHWRFPFYQTHRNSNPVREAIAYLRRRLRRAGAQARSAREEARLERRRFFLVPLQLDSDFQIRSHSPFRSIRSVLEHVLSSFARYAPADVLLAIKEHPLDLGTIDWCATVAEIADTMQIADRIVFLEYGDLETLVEKSAGVVTVNSTSGTLALASGKPVKVLGDAIYGIADITDQQPLADFWSAPKPPDPTTWDAFCRVLRQRCLLPGAFLSAVGMDQLIAATVARLTAETEPCGNEAASPAAHRNIRH